MRYSGKVVIVTGGSSGIGRATCIAMAREGARVVVAGRNMENANKVVEEIKAQNGEAVAQKLDVASLQSAQQMADDTISRFGKIDVLVNNAGWDKVQPFIETTEDLWDKIIAINLKGQINCVKAVLNYMIEAKYGKIVNIVSDAARNGGPGEAVYSSAKGGVIAFTKAVAREVAGHGINVNCVSPGAIETPLLDELLAGDSKVIEALTKRIPQGRLGKPKDVAKAILFMGSDDADYITGQTLSVSGGLSMV